ncbi:MAG: DUF5000 domain-containing lipoprotein [Draconibacterium sp.]
MKKYIISIAILVFFAYSCSEEPIGQFPVDDVSPQMISNPVVSNFKGGATIKYDLPGDKDLLCIKAVYTLPNGEKKEKLASAFINELTIEGFAKASKTSVSLIAVDKSKNESDPVTVEIEPLDSPIFDIYSSLSVIATFGGLKLTWENPEKKDIVVGIIAKNEENVYVPLENFYTSVGEGSGSVRGLESKETEFGVFIRDIYNNYTDTLFSVLTPWEEIELDKGLWKGMPLCSSFTLSQYGGAVSVLWDGRTVAEGNQTYYINRTSSDPIFFTLDLGVTTKLSRFKFWGRNQWYFNLHHPKEFEIWGTNDPDVANGGSCSWDGWELLLSGTSTKPSGDEATSYANLTSEDLALALSGEEFEFSLEVPEVRYVRFRTLRTWTDSNSSFIAELTFWGQVNE